MLLRRIARFFILTLLSFIFLQTAVAKDKSIPQEKWQQLEELKIFQKAYPDIKFIPAYDKKKEDWLVRVIIPALKETEKKEIQLYWCESRFLPEEQLENKSNYRKMLYNYQRSVPDPKNFTEEDIKEIKEFTSKENRKNGAIDPPFLFNEIYDCKTQKATEQHIVKTTLMGKPLNVHERIIEPLNRVSKKIQSLPETPELKKFYSTLTRTDCYAWRTVRDTQSRSFHSIGVAIDILPKGYYQKVIYWGWQKQLRPDDWYMTPLSVRWTPPQEIIDIFASEGFIWGGTWAVWDNMHFEYHPELIINSQDAS